MIKRILVRLFLGIGLSLVFADATAQNQLLMEADSLFNQQKYTEALDKYESLYNAGLSSPATLLKMAFIQDASGNYADAIYYMDKYYLRTADRGVIGKILEVANANELSGYKYDDITYFTALLAKYRIWVVVFLAILMISLSIYIFEKTQENQKSVSAFVLQILVGAIFFAFINLKTNTRGIITSDQTLLRSGPSAGAEPLDIINKGHKVRVLSQDDVWSKILWEGEEVYVRNGRLKTI